mgnify:CR=1 FL=1
MQSRNHWDQVYREKQPDRVSWYQPRADLSLQWILAAAPPPHAAIIDAGGGASTLVDSLLDAGYSRLTVLDLAPEALAISQARLGDRAPAVEWLTGDLTRTALPAGAYDVWHDRAVFHFLTTADERAAYLETAQRSVKPGGHLIAATFADDGPQQCSGLPVVRYSAAALQAEFEPFFAPLAHRQEEHRTPSGTLQRFSYCLFRRKAS